MFVIGERINGMFQNVRKGIETRNKSIIHAVAKEQLDAGADALDINVGPAKGKAVDNMLWLIEAAQEATNKPLCIDTPKFDVMQAAVKACRNRCIINSTKATEEALQRYSALAAQNNAQLIALTIDASGVPADVDSRVMMGATIVTKCMEAGMNVTDIIIDPVILPVNVAPKGPKNVMEAIRQLKLLSNPPPKFVIGLSNVSQSCRETHLLNRVYLAMAIAAGLDSAIMDPTDKDLMQAAISAELLMEKQIYCDDYISAYMRSK